MTSSRSAEIDLYRDAATPLRGRRNILTSVLAGVLVSGDSRRCDALVAYALPK